MVRKKREKKSRSQVEFMDKKVLGVEPEYSVLAPLTDLEIGQSYNWYNYMEDMESSREFLSEYLNSKGKTEHAELIDSVEDNSYIITCGWTARLLSKYSLPNGYEERLLAKVEKMLSTIKDEPEDTPQTSVLDKTNNKADRIIGDFEAIVDKRSKDFNMYEWLQNNQISKPIAQKIKETYAAWAKELRECRTTTDTQLKEAYSRYPKSFINDANAWFTSVFNDIDRYCDNVKKVRKPRIKKIPSIDKILKDFKYAKDNIEYKIVSVNPQKIIGSSEVWLFNTESRTLSVLRGEKLSVKGSSIIGYDESKSVQKRVRESKLETVLSCVSKNNKSFVKNMFNEINSVEYPAKGRVSDKVVIMRVF